MKGDKKAQTIQAMIEISIILFCPSSFLKKSTFICFPSKDFVRKFSISTSFSTSNGKLLLNPKKLKKNHYYWFKGLVIVVSLPVNICFIHDHQSEKEWNVRTVPYIWSTFDTFLKWVFLHFRLADSTSIVRHNISNTYK